MSDLLTWSPIPLGRWFGTTVKVHVSLIVFVGLTLLFAPFEADRRGLAAALAQATTWLGLLLLALAVHEFAHALMAWVTVCELEDDHLWPLGSLAAPIDPPRGLNYLLSVMAGPFASGVTAFSTAALLGIVWDAEFAWNPLGPDADPGAPWIHAATKAEPMTAPWVVGWFGFINYWLLLANLLPALPFDLGRMLRWYLANASNGPTPRDGVAAPWTARVVGAVLFVVGVLRLVVWHHVDGLGFVAVAVVIELMALSEPRTREDVGFFEEGGLLGYDFSEGYTSLEENPPKVRPYRESALKRWRRRRAEQRRQRLMMEELAEERRLDQILDKLYHQGKAALTDEEHRFLVRVSVRLRNRHNAQHSRN